MPIELTPIARLSRDMRKAAATLSDTEARFLVDAYYLVQENRIRAAAQIRSMSENGEPVTLLLWLSEQMRNLESQVKGALDKYSEGHPVGRWARSVVGVGPVIGAGLLAHIDITKAPTAGHIFSFAGLNPKQEWKKGEKRPWNADLKTLCWKMGESFVKTQGHPDAVYGPLYAERKAREIAQNEAGEFAEQAAKVLKTRRIGKMTEAYKWYSGEHAIKTVPSAWRLTALRGDIHHRVDTINKAKASRHNEIVSHLMKIYGTVDESEWRFVEDVTDQESEGNIKPMLPPAHIHARAKRFAVKIFLSNLHEVWFKQEYGVPAPAPYPHAHMGHVHKIEP